MIQRVLYSLALLLQLSMATTAQPIIDCGHSHNDYTHTHPLTDALSYGYKSIEVDVFLHHDQLIVSHTADGLDHKPNIETLYLQPLLERVKQNNGWVYKGDTTPTILMVEFKTDGEEGYQKLKTLITKYQSLYCDRMGKGGPIKILITGHRPWQTVQQGKELYVTLDGTIAQSATATPSYIMERVSDPYSSYFSWHGRGKMPKAQLQKLDTLVSIAHAHGRQLRFYACPQNENLWTTLLDAGVDWINVDDLARFATFYAMYLVESKKPKNCHCVRM